jgi:hypothetical protein
MRTANLSLAAMATMLLLAASGPASGHPGGTNAQGCHTNHKTGDYHCHTPKVASPSTVSFCHVLNGQDRCGYSRSTCTQLASERGGSCRQQ